MQFVRRSEERERGWRRECLRMFDFVLFLRNILFLFIAKHFQRRRMLYRMNETERGELNLNFLFPSLYTRMHGWVRWIFCLFLFSVENKVLFLKYKMWVVGHLHSRSSSSALNDHYTVDINDEDVWTQKKKTKIIINANYKCRSRL